MGGGKSAGSPNTVGQGTTWSAQQFGTGVQGAAAGVSSDSGNASSTTHSGISAGAVTITDEAAQQQKTGQSASEAAASIQSNVLTGDGSNGLQKNWDGQKLLQEQAANAQIMATFGQQASKTAGTYADQQAIAARRADNEAEARKWDEGGEYRTALHAEIGALTGVSAIALPEIGERIAALNLPDSVRDVLNASIGAALGAVGGASGAAAGLNQAGNKYISHSPFRLVRQTVSQENARLLNECGANCSQADFLSIDQQVAQVERAANLAAIGQISSMTQRQAQELAQLMLELAPFYGTGESALQLITGKSSVTEQEASRFWAAIGVVPVAGGVLKKVGEASAFAASALLKDLRLTGGVKEGGNLLPSPKPRSVIPNALDPAEIAQAQEIVAFRGGTFEGVPSKNFPGIDGWLDGVPIQLKTVEGKSILAIQRNIIGAAKDMSKAGYVGDVYIDATKTGVGIGKITDFTKPGTPISNMLNEGVVKSISIKTGEGWLTITRSVIAK